MKITPELYNLPGVTAERVETREGRAYDVIDNRTETPIKKRYWSVSTIIQGVKSGGAYDEWNIEQGERYGAEGARFSSIVRMEIGSTIHDMIRRGLNGELISFTDADGKVLYDDREIKAYCAFASWFMAKPTKV